MKNNWTDGRKLFNYLTNPNNKWTDFERGVRFFILNRITFSGTVESGGYSSQSFNKRFTQSSIDRLIHLPFFLKDVVIECGDYEKMIFEPGDDVFIFLDPPYYKTSKSKLYGKKGDLHTSFNHERFANNMKICPHNWLLTYDDSTKIRELFNFAFIKEWKLQYGMNNYQQARAKKGNELFISKYNLAN